jgi:tRNA-modifying protein YgfZ
MPHRVFLDHRAVLLVTGPEAEPFLNGLLTQSTLGLATGERRYGALLTPQGKVIADMIVERTDDGFLLDVDAVAAPALLKRLRLFKLRAQVAIDARDDLCVIAFDGAADPRAVAAPHRKYDARNSAVDGDISAYHSARIAAGLPEQGLDFDSDDVFPADINMDLLNGVDFRKGCFVGQEVVSRMKRRSITRRRTLTAHAPGAAPGPILAGDFEIGTLTSVADDLGLARIRIDRLAEADAAGQTVTVNGVPLVVSKPDWLAAELAALQSAKDARA